MGESSPLLTRDAIKAAARDAGTLLLAEEMQWVTEAEVCQALVSAGHSKPLACLALKYLVDTQLVEVKFKYFGPEIEGWTLDEARVVEKFSPTPDPPHAEGYSCVRATPALREWCSAPTGSTRMGQGEGNGGAGPTPGQEQSPLVPAEESVLRRDALSKLAPAAKSEEPQGARTAKRKRGRPADTNQKEDKRIYEAWKTGRHRTQADCDRELGLSAGMTYAACERHRKRLDRRNRHRRTK